MFGTFIRRVLGVMGLDRTTFEDIEADPRATWQAMVVVLSTSVAAGIGNRGIGDFSPVGMAVGAAVALTAWTAWALLVYFIGVHLLPGPSTRADAGQLLRTVGFAAAPGLFRVFEVFGQTSWLVFPITSVWMLAAMTVGVRQALDYETTGRAVAVCLLGWLLSLAIALGVGFLMPVPVW